MESWKSFFLFSWGMGGIFPWILVCNIILKHVNLNDKQNLNVSYTGGSQKKKPWLLFRLMFNYFSSIIMTFPPPQKIIIRDTENSV